MQEFIFRSNIERFQKLIATECDAAKRQSLERLLAEEEAKLQAFKVHGNGPALTASEPHPPRDRSPDDRPRADS